jgi:hypothetical protein
MILAFAFGVLGVTFFLLKEKGAILISGFNTLQKKEREEYDQKKMSANMRNSFLLWFGILFLGAVLSYFYSKIFAMIAIGIWLILFLKDVHLDTEKAFNKYKKNSL